VTSARPRIRVGGRKNGNGYLEKNGGIPGKKLYFVHYNGKGGTYVVKKKGKSVKGPK